MIFFGNKNRAKWEKALTMTIIIDSNNVSKINTWFYVTTMLKY